VTSAELTIEPLAGLDEARAEWAALAAASGNVYATPEWCDAWLQHAVPGYDLEPRLFGARREDGTLAAILPLVVVRGRYVRKLRFLGFGAANQLGPIAASDDGAAATGALRQVLEATASDWDVFHGESLPAGDWAARLGATEIGREGSPVARAESWEDYLRGRSRSLRKELGQKERRLAERGLAYKTVESEADLGRGLDALFALHRARWGADASPWFAGAEAFHRAFAAAAHRRGWLRLRLLEVDGSPVAANYSFRFGDVEWSYQHGRDPAFEDASVGLLILARAIHEAFDEGATEFSLGPGAQAYKLRFATDDPGLDSVARVHGLRGRAWLLAAKRA
jgi:CelD/BcsL family acetyltransferase involved in cellulose biosynthesis